jgi:hypothetical protein
MRYQGAESKQTEYNELIQASLIRVSFGTGSPGLENSQADFPYFLPYVILEFFNFYISKSKAVEERTNLL